MRRPSYRNYPRRWRPDEDREDVDSTETWNGGEGTISFNRLQQSVHDDEPHLPTPVEAADSTDPWDIVEEGAD